MVQYMKVQLRELKIVNYRPLILGSKASLKPSPRKFILKTVSDIARPGHITLWDGAVNNLLHNLKDDPTLENQVGSPVLKMKVHSL